MTTHDIDHLHHVGHIVGDMQTALDLYTRLGFLPTPPSYPALPTEEGGEPRAFGVGNSHATFMRNFIELASRVHGDRPVPEGARLGPLEVPAEVLPLVTAMVTKSVDMIDWCLARFEGLHILVFDAPDAQAVADRYAAAGVVHGRLTEVERKIETADGSQLARVRFMEVEPHDGGPSRVPEGRIAVAEPPELERLVAEMYMDHPNGAYDLVESMLCVADGELNAVAHRYETYLGRGVHAEGSALVLDLEDARVTLVPASALGSVLPGEKAPGLPGFVAYAVAVHDASATTRLLEANGLPVRTTATGDPFVPSEAAFGANVIFRQLA
jgi:hypothetical protein